MRIYIFFLSIICINLDAASVKHHSRVRRDTNENGTKYWRACTRREASVFPEMDCLWAMVWFRTSCGLGRNSSELCVKYEFQNDSTQNDSPERFTLFKPTTANTYTVDNFHCNCRRTKHGNDPVCHAFIVPVQEFNAVIYDLFICYFVDKIEKVGTSLTTPVPEKEKSSDEKTCSCPCACSNWNYIARRTNVWNFVNKLL